MSQHHKTKWKTESSLILILSSSFMRSMCTCVSLFRNTYTYTNEHIYKHKQTVHTHTNTHINIQTLVSQYCHTEVYQLCRGDQPPTCWCNATTSPITVPPAHFSSHYKPLPPGSESSTLPLQYQGRLTSFCKLNVRKVNLKGESVKKSDTPMSLLAWSKATM